MNALRDETKTKVVEPGLPVLDKLRMSPTLFEVLRGEMNDRETWAEFFTEAGVLLASMRRMIRSDLTGNHHLLGRIMGLASYVAVDRATTNGAHPTDVGPSHERRKPLAKAGGR